MASSPTLERPSIEAPCEQTAQVSPTKRSSTQTDYPPRQSSKRHSKRLTINFPVLPPLPTPEGHATSPLLPPSPGPSRGNSPRVPAMTSPTDATGFLTALASQERKVLELREELQRAEAELTNLKKHWAQHEANRKKNELRHVERLQPLSPPLARIDTDHGGTLSSRPSADRLERRATLRSDLPRKPKQRVFSGSRHTRTLSLLSPGSANPDATPFTTLEVAFSPSEIGADVPPLSRSSTMPSVAEDAAATFTKTYKDLATASRSMPAAPREVLVKTGKQMANDLKDGLWTFFEDIRQATVGEEGISGTESRTTAPSASTPAGLRRQSSKVTSREKQRASDPQKPGKDNGSLQNEALGKGRSRGKTDEADSSSFWREFGVDTPKLKDQPDPGLRTTTQPSLLDIDDSWDAWDSPTSQQKTHSPNPSNSTTLSVGAETPVTDQSSPRTSTSSAGDETLKPGEMKSPHAERDALPWPALTKMTPSKLTRTASNLMAEWEKSLSPQAASDIRGLGKED